MKILQLATFSLIFFTGVLPVMAQQTVSLKVQKGHYDAIDATSISGDMHWGVTGGRDSKIILWDMGTGGEVRTFSGHTDDILGLMFSSDSRIIISASRDKSVKVWNTNDGSLIKSFDNHKKAVTGLSWLEKDHQFLSSSEDGTVMICDVRTSQQRVFIKDFHAGGIFAMGVAPNGKRVITMGLDNSIKAWDENGNPVWRYLGTSGLFVQSLSVNDSRVAIGYGNLNQNRTKKVIEILDLETGTLLNTIPAHEGHINALSFLGNSNLLISGSALSPYNLPGEENLILWDTNKGDKLHSFENLYARVTSISISADETFALVGCGDYTAHLFEIRRGQRLDSFQGYSYPLSKVSYAGFIGAVGATDGVVRVFDLVTAKLLLSIQRSVDPINGIAFDSTANNLLFASGPFVYSINIKSKKVRKVYENDVEVSAMVRKSSQDFIIGDVAGKIKCVNLKGKLIKEFPGLKETVTSIASSHDGDGVVAGFFVSNLATKREARKTIKFVHFEAGEIVETFTKHHGMVNAVAFSRDDKFIIHNEDRRLILRLRNGNGQKISIKVDSEITALALPTDGSVITAAIDGKITKWDVKSKTRIFSIAAHTAGISDIAISADGNQLIASTEDGIVKFLNLSSQQENYTIVPLKGSSMSYIALTPENYFLSSRNGITGVHYVYHNNVLNFDQFEMLFNRPDLVIARSSLADSSLVSKYTRAYKRRLTYVDRKRVMGLNEAIDNLPFVDISVNERYFETDTRDLRFNIKASDYKYLLSRIDILVNGVPAFGSKGILVDSEKADLNINLILSRGKNKIEVFATNGAGLGSLRESFVVNFLSTNQRQ